MLPAVTLDSLFGQVDAMRACMAREDAVGTGHLLILHDQDLRRFLADPTSDSGGAEVLGRLLAAQRAVIDLMTAAREGSRLQLQASRQNDRAARAYLANVES